MWVVSLCAAVSGLMIVDVFRQSLTSTLQLQGRKILSADVSLFTRRALTEDEKKVVQDSMPAGSRFAELTEIFTMATVKGASRLAMVRFLSDDFPLLGDFKVLENGVLSDGKGASLAGGNRAWAGGDFFALMDAKIGDEVKIGHATYILSGEIKRESSQTFRFRSIGPRIYLHQSALPKTGLIQYGSTMSQVYFAAAEKEVEPAPLKEKLESKFSDGSIQITIPADLEQSSLSVLSRLLDFLGLTGLITLSLGWIGVYYLGRRWLTLETLSSGILKCLGLSSSELRNLLLLKLTLILVTGVALGGAAAWSGSNLLLPLFRDSLPDEFTLVWSWKSTLLLVVIGPVAGLILLYQAVKELAFEKPLALFQERIQSKTANFVRLIWIIVLVSGLFFALTFLQARSWKVTGTFLGALSASIILIVALAYGFLYSMRRLVRARWGWMPHLIVALWTRRPATTLLLITVSALAGLLSQLLPHMEKTLVAELSSPETIERPSLFMVDIQDEQLTPLKNFMKENKIEIAGQLPFIRARILTVNGSGFERAKIDNWSTREEEQDARFRNRGVNLTYRKKLADSETIISGKEWKDLSINPAEIAVEDRYASRLGLKLGDVLNFDVQGLMIEARVASLRTVKWDSFTPNFFIQFPDGVLNEAPKTWVMAVKGSKKFAPSQMQTMVTKEFPNIASINIAEILSNARELVDKLSSALKLSSRLSLALGIFVFLMIILFQLVSARRDWRQLLVLGLTRKQVWLMQVTGYGVLCLIGTLIGTVLSLGVSWGLFKFAFNTGTEFDFAGMIQIWLWTWTAAFIGFGWLGFNEVTRSRKEGLLVE